MVGADEAAEARRVHVVNEGGLREQAARNVERRRGPVDGGDSSPHDPEG